jgi:ubiquitin-like 1-activating enzyme E1 B
MAGNIIPAIATTNAIASGLCVLEALKILRNELDKGRWISLSGSSERLKRSFGFERLQPPNPKCPVCSGVQSTLLVDTSRATLNDLVQDLLRLQLGYGEEFSINSESGLLYDPEEDQNLPKTFDELGLKQDTFITVVDESDENAKVNVVFAISEQALDSDSKPIHLSDKLKIPTKPKDAAPAETNGHTHPITNGVSNGKRKREADAADVEIELAAKRGKVIPEPSDGIVLIDDPDEGVIAID